MATNSAAISFEGTGFSASERTTVDHHLFHGFLAWVLLLPLLLYLSVFPLLRLHSFERWSPSHWGPVLDFAFDIAHQNADVVIFGDSTAFIGIDPRRVNARLGLKSIVMPNTIGGLPVTRDLALHRYLANNKPPRLLVLYFSAWNLDYMRAANDHLFEGEEMLFRHGSLSEISGFTLHHPRETALFPLRLYSTLRLSTIRSALHGENRAQSTAEALGHVDDVEPFSAIQEPCTIPQRYLSLHNDDSVRALQQRYRKAGLQVMVYIAPVPECSNTDRLRERSFAELGASAPNILPAGGFLADSYFAHLKPALVPLASNLFANALEAKLKPADITKVTR